MRVVESAVMWDWRESKAKAWLAEFVVEGRQYEALFEPVTDTTWSFEFYLQDGDRSRIDETGTGNGHAVFTTVINIAKDFAKSHENVMLLMSARCRIGEARARLYQRIIERYVPDAQPSQRQNYVVWKVPARALIQ